jgi:hypothetical protein
MRDLSVNKLGVYKCSLKTKRIRLDWLSDPVLKYSEDP